MITHHTGTHYDHHNMTQHPGIHYDPSVLQHQGMHYDPHLQQQIMHYDPHYSTGHINTPVQKKPGRLKCPAIRQHSRNHYGEIKAESRRPHPAIIQQSIQEYGVHDPLFNNRNNGSFYHPQQFYQRNTGPHSENITTITETFHNFSPSTRNSMSHSYPQEPKPVFNSDSYRSPTSSSSQLSVTASHLLNKPVVCRSPTEITGFPGFPAQEESLLSDKSSTVDYGSFSKDFSYDNFQESFMDIFSSTTPSESSNVEGFTNRHFRSPVVHKHDPDIAGSDWPYLVPQFDDLYSSECDLSAHYKTMKRPSPEGAVPQNDEGQGPSRKYTADYYTLTYTEPDVNGDVKNTAEYQQRIKMSKNRSLEDSVPSERQALRGGIHPSKSDDILEQSRSADEFIESSANKRQISVDSNKSVLSSDVDAYGDTAELLPKRGSKQKDKKQSTVKPGLNNGKQLSQSIYTDSHSNRSVSADRNGSAISASKSHGTLLTSSRCAIKFHNLQVKPEDIIEAEKKHKLYASNLGEGLIPDDFWMEQNLKKIGSDSGVEIAEILDENHHVLAKDIHDWTFDESDNKQSDDVNGNNEIIVTIVPDKPKFTDRANNSNNNVSHTNKANEKEPFENKEKDTFENRGIKTIFSLLDNISARLGNITSPSHNSKPLEMTQVVAQIHQVQPFDEKQDFEKGEKDVEVKEKSEKEKVYAVDVHDNNENVIKEIEGYNENAVKPYSKDKWRDVEEATHHKAIGEAIYSVNVNEQYRDNNNQLEHSQLKHNIQCDARDIIMNENDKNEEKEKCLTTENVGSPRQRSHTQECDGDKGKYLSPSTEKAKELSKSESDTSGHSRAKPLQKVVYYQNRFITVPVDPKTVKSGSPSRDRLIMRSSSLSVESKKFGSQKQRLGQTSPLLNKSKSVDQADETDAVATTIAMQADSGTLTSSKADIMISKIKDILQDKRDSDFDLANIRHKQPEAGPGRTNPILKRILNYVFIATGLVLLVSVLSVIIYFTINKFL